MCIQGGRPSPFDRNMGSRMAIKCAEKLLEQIQASKKPDGQLYVDSLFDSFTICCSVCIEKVVKLFMPAVLIV